MFSNDTAGNWTALTLALWERVEVEVDGWSIPTAMIFETLNISKGILDVYTRPFPQPVPEAPCSP